MGSCSHSLLCFIILIASQIFLARELRKSARCVKQHFAFECLALHGLKDRYNGLFVDHAATIVKFMRKKINQSSSL